MLLHRYSGENGYPPLASIASRVSCNAPSLVAVRTSLQGEHGATLALEAMHHKGVARGYRPALFPLIIGGRSVPFTSESGANGDGGMRSPASSRGNGWTISLCLSRAELHDPADPLPTAAEPGRQRIRLCAAYRQQFHPVPCAVEAAGSRGAHSRGRLHPVIDRTFPFAAELWPTRSQLVGNVPPGLMRAASASGETACWSAIVVPAMIIRPN